MLACALACASCSSAPDPTLRVPTHTEYSFTNSARFDGKLAADVKGCLLLVRSDGVRMYFAFPLKSVSTTDTSLTLAGRTYQVGDPIALGGGGSAVRHQA